jgi:hypothetical protein
MFAAIEAYHMIRHNGSITERLYGFQRCQADKSALNWIQMTLSLIELVGVPYLKYVLDNYGNLPGKEKPVLKKVLLFHDLFGLACRLAYIYSKTNSYSLLMFIGRLQYTRSGESQSLMPFEGWMGTGLFLVRFVDWWKTQSGLDQPKSYAVVVPPAPKPTRDQSRHSHGVCGICIGELHEPVSTRSGIVYCARCLSTYRLLHDGMCPLTHAVLLDSDITPIFLE